MRLRFFRSSSFCQSSFCQSSFSQLPVPSVYLLLNPILPLALFSFFCQSSFCQSSFRSLPHLFATHLFATFPSFSHLSAIHFSASSLSLPSFIFLSPIFLPILPRLNEFDAHRRSHARDVLPGPAQSARRRINAESNDVVGILILRQKIFARRIDREVARCLPLG